MKTTVFNRPYWRVYIEDFGQKRIEKYNIFNHDEFWDMCNIMWIDVHDHNPEIQIYRSNPAGLKSFLHLPNHMQFSGLCIRAGHNLGQLLRDGCLPRPVVFQREIVDHLLCIVRRVLHCHAARRLLGRSHSTECPRDTAESANQTPLPATGRSLSGFAVRDCAPYSARG